MGVDTARACGWGYGWFTSVVSTKIYYLYMHLFLWYTCENCDCSELSEAVDVWWQVSICQQKCFTSVFPQKAFNQKATKSYIQEVKWHKALCKFFLSVVLVQGRARLPWQLKFRQWVHWMKMCHKVLLHFFLLNCFLDIDETSWIMELYTLQDIRID